MNSDTFYSYIANNFFPWLTEKHITTPVILFVDGHISHRSLKLSEFCLENKIILVSFLPNATHLQQPMDVVVFKPMKTKWASTINTHKCENPGVESISKPDFCQLLEKCLNDCMTPELIKKSFETTALFPFGAQHYDFSRLLIQNSEDEETQDDDNDDSSHGFFDKIQDLIGNLLPHRVDEFQSCTGDWEGDVDAKELFMVWSHLKNMSEKNTSTIVNNTSHLDSTSEPDSSLYLTAESTDLDDTSDNTS